MGDKPVETSTENNDEALKASRDANALLLNCIAAMSEAIVARDKYIEFLTASGRFTMADVHASDSLANDVISKTGVAYGLVPIKEMIPTRYQHLFGACLKHGDAEKPAPSAQKEQPKQPAPEHPTAEPQNVTSEAFKAAEIVLKFAYDNRASAAEFSRSTTAAILSWYNTYLTTVLNKMRNEKINAFSDEIGITKELLVRDGFIDQLKMFSRSFSNQTNVKIRLVMPDGSSSLIIPMTGLT